jgi:acetyl esterase
MKTEPRTTGVNPELEAAIPMFPPADLSDPVTARRHLAELAGNASTPEIPHMEIVDRAAPGDPDVPVRIYRVRCAGRDRLAAWRWVRHG